MILQDVLFFILTVSSCPPSRAAQARRAGKKLSKLNPAWPKRALVWL